MLAGTTIVLAALALYYLRKRRARKTGQQAPTPAQA